MADARPRNGGGVVLTELVHELIEPLTSVGAEAAACLNWMSGEPPNLKEARRSLAFILKDVERASAALSELRERLVQGEGERADSKDDA